MTGTGIPRPHLRLEPLDEQASVTTLELFFDLVFVFALTQATALMADDISARSVVRGVLVVALLWWSWTGYAWIGNAVRADEGPVRLVLFAAMAAMFVLALAIPEAFTDLPGGLSGPVVVALCYFVFRLLHILFYFVIARDDPGLRHQLFRFAPAMLAGTTLLLIASEFRGTAQTLLWALALIADYGGTLAGGADGWRIRSPKHFAERHGLIVIIALGESIVAIGVGVAELPVAWPIVGASVVGLTLAAAMWWTYFDISALQGEHALANEPEASRPRLARDAYSFAHLPIVVGVALTALGLKKVLEYVGDREHHELGDSLNGTPLYALFAGVALYLVGHVAFKWVTVHHLSSSRLVTVVAVLALIPVAGAIPAIAALALVTAALVGLVVFETVAYAEHRHRIRHEIHGTQPG
jgi:low temperature requirement protein LtrA